MRNKLQETPRFYAPQTLFLGNPGYSKSIKKSYQCVRMLVFMGVMMDFQTHDTYINLHYSRSNKGLSASFLLKDKFKNTDVHIHTAYSKQTFTKLYDS